MTVAVLQFQLDLSLRCCRPASHLGDFVLKTMRDIDACTILSAGHRVLDRFANALSDTSYDKPAFAGVDVDIKLNGAKIGS